VRDNLLLGDDIFFRQLAKKLPSKLNLVRKGRIVDYMMFCPIGTNVIVMPVKWQL
jgi:hypothetical protein